MNAVRFQILPPVDRPGEAVRICGNHPTLGEWNTERALELRWQPPFHVGEIHAAHGSTLAYKILRGTSWESEACDATGRSMPDMVHDVTGDVLLSHTVPDWRDRQSGRLLTETISSCILDGERTVSVWLPHGHHHGGEKYPLIVTGDGDNVFDPETSFSGTDLALDEWVRLLSAEGTLPPCVVAAVHHPTGENEWGESFRDRELSPERSGASYAQFLVSELIPFLEERFHLKESPENRTLVGASLGALNAFFTAIHHPGVFGRFACLSTSFEDLSESLPHETGELAALARTPALPPNTRMFFDYGENGLDECYEPYHNELAELLLAKGWQENREFTIRKVSGGTHHERSWRQRLGDALRFLAQ
jgi:enterochelin esterase-like enzyme